MITNRASFLLLALALFCCHNYSMDASTKNEISTLIQAHGKLMLATTWCRQKCSGIVYSVSHDWQGAFCYHKKALEALLEIGTSQVCLYHQNLTLDHATGLSALEIALQSIDPEVAKKHAKHFKTLIDCAINNKEK